MGRKKATDNSTEETSKIPVPIHNRENYEYMKSFFDERYTLRQESWLMDRDIRNELTSIREKINECATKTELKETRAELKEEINKLDSKIDKLDAKIDSKIDKLDAKMDNHLKWIITFMFGFGVALMSGITYLIKF